MAHIEATTYTLARIVYEPKKKNRLNNVRVSDFYAGFARVISLPKTQNLSRHELNSPL